MVQLLPPWRHNPCKAVKTFIPGRFPVTQVVAYSLPVSIDENSTWFAVDVGHQMKMKSLSNGKRFYSSKDLAQILSVNESTIKRWADSGKLRCFRTVGNHRRFPPEAVKEFVVRYQMEMSLPDIAFNDSFPI
jgi:excisionase family DNA binding protein